MSKNQKWVTIVFSFILLFTIAVGSIACVILNSPAATGKIDIDADAWFEMSKDGELQVQSIHLNRIQGEFNNKILDLILIFIKKGNYPLTSSN